MSREKKSLIPDLLRIDDAVAILPVIHGGGQFALTTRRWMLEEHFDAIAVPLPESFREPVERAVLELPKPSIVIQRPKPHFSPGQWNQDLDSPLGWEPSVDSADNENGFDAEEPETVSYVPIDPCQSVIMAIRAAMGEHVPRHYIDLEVDQFRPYATVMPDPFAVRHVAPERFAAAVLPHITRPPESQTRDRMLYMAWRLHELAKAGKKVLLVTSVLHWPWIREAYSQIRAGQSDDSESNSAIDAGALLDLPEHEEVEEAIEYDIDPKTLIFLFGELPFITSLYERARLELEDDEDLQIDGVKELLIAARDSYRQEFGKRGRRITPLLLSKCLQYIRNLSLIHRRMTPDLVTIVTAAKQMMGDPFALHVAEKANEYEFTDAGDTPTSVMDQTVTLGIDQARLPSGDTVLLVNRLPGPPMSWHTIELQRRPKNFEKQKWQYSWNPYRQCSYPPEDGRIEDFRTRVFDRAEAILGNDLARTEKFTTSVKDGIDIRDTLRHWYDKEIYVKVVPPSRGSLDACVMLFDSPADPRDYPWRTTWFAEHKNESTLAFFATNFRDEMVGPGIGLGIYGGAMFLYPPVAIHDIWTDPRLDYTETLEERIIASACLHSQSNQIAILSSLPPGSGFRRLARRHKKQLIHVPLGSFSDEQIQQLRMVHVLNGQEVRSYAEAFIRKA